MSPIVEIKNISKCFGSNRVLEDVSFTVQKGSVVAIIGASGSGKSTALRCIDRLEVVDAGHIRVCGHEVTGPNVDLNELRRDVGIVFQSYNLFPHLTVEENIMLAPRLVKKVRKDEARERAHAVLAQVGLADKVRALPQQLLTPLGAQGAGLSGGESRRLAVARTLLHPAPLILLDEPTEGLDCISAEAVMQALASWQQQRSQQGAGSLLMASHLQREARHADRIVWIDQHGIAAQARKGSAQFEQLLQRLRPG